MVGLGPWCGGGTVTEALPHKSGAALSLHFADALGMMHIAILKVIKLKPSSSRKQHRGWELPCLASQCLSGCLSGGAVDLPVFRCLKGD